MSNTSPDSSQAPAVIEIDPAVPVLDPWAKAKRYVESATLFQRASLAAQIMAGVELAELRKTFPETRGRPAKGNKPHDAVISWAEAVDQKLGVSPDTAARWVEMAHAAKKRLSSGDLTLGAILEKHPGTLTSAEQELLKTAVHKISDGRTQLEFLLECGVTKAPQGSGARGGNTRPAALANAAAANEAGTEGAPAAEPADAWEPRAKHLNDLCVEALGDQWWNECGEAERRRLHGNLLDAVNAISATLKPARS